MVRSRLGEANVVGIRSVAQHPYILIGRRSALARTYWVHCTRGARFDRPIMLPGLPDAHTDTLRARFATWERV